MMSVFRRQGKVSNKKAPGGTSTRSGASDVNKPSGAMEKEGLLSERSPKTEVNPVFKKEYNTSLIKSQ